MARVFGLEAVRMADADVIPYDWETVVLDDLVRDELLLGIPMIPLCSEACPGIRPERQSRDTPSAADETPVPDEVPAPTTWRQAA